MNDKSNKEETIQQPGADIRPHISSTDQVISLAERLYGIKIKKIKQLDGYDDKNYHLMLSEDKPFNEHTNISSVWPHGYVLKILNSLDTKDIGFVEAQTKLLIHVGNQGICVPEPVKNVKGNFISVEPLKSKNGENVTYHAVRLFKYHKGILLKSVTSIKPLPSSVFSDLLYDVGQKTAILDNIMKDFQDDVLSKRTSLWHMKNALKIKDYLFVIKEEEKVSLVLKVLKEFEETVISKLTNLKTGLLHGDVNESNMLVENHNDCNKEQLSGYKVSVILDFGDIQVSSYILELAVVMCYMMLQTGSLDSGASVLQGYHSVKPLPIDEYKLLPISICARLCQSLVLGMYTFTKVDPSNHYVLLTQAAGWDLLKKITSTDREIINEIWLKDILCN